VSTQGDDHLGRVRIAATLGCPPHDPHRPPRSPAPGGSESGTPCSDSDLAAALTAVG